MEPREAQRDTGGAQGGLGTGVRDVRRPVSSAARWPGSAFLFSSARRALPREPQWRDPHAVEAMHLQCGTGGGGPPGGCSSAPSWEHAVWNPRGRARTGQAPLRAAGGTGCERHWGRPSAGPRWVRGGLPEASVCGAQAAAGHGLRSPCSSRSCGQEAGLCHSCCAGTRRGITCRGCLRGRGVCEGGGQGGRPGVMSTAGRCVEG